MSPQVGSEEWKVVILAHQKCQSLVEIRESPFARDVPASKLRKREGKLSIRSMRPIPHCLVLFFLSEQVSPDFLVL